MPTVDQQVREYYASQSLSDERLQEMLALAQERRAVRRRRRLIATAAVLLVSLASWWLWTVFAARGLADRAAAEVAMNHRKDLGVEVASTDYAELGEALHKLNFALEPPRNRLTRGYRLVGGRYCSIQAQLAAQLKIHDPDTGDTATLYITEATPALTDLDGAHRALDDVVIDMWQQNGLIYALAETVD